MAIGFRMTRATAPPPRRSLLLIGTLRCAIVPVLCGILWPQPPALGETALNERVLVVYNSSASDSLAVAKYYMALRKIPESNRCKIAAPSDDALNQADFDSRVKMPIRTCIEAVGKKKILYIVFSYRTPYALTIDNRSYSLDQFVADIWDEYSASRPGNEAGSHPYFGGAQSQGNAYEAFVPLAAFRERPSALNIYSVWRLDAASATLAKGLVDKALLAESRGLSGKGCFDLQYGDTDVIADVHSASGDWDIHRAADFARRAGFPVIEDNQGAEFGTKPAPLRCDGAALYAGWYSLDHYNDAFSWNPGAIGIHLDSASAVNPRGGTNWAANAVIKGLTVTSGSVAEPYLSGLPHPDQVILYVLQGANVGDAFLRGTQWLKWMLLNIGDPLYRPFARGMAPFNAPGHHETFLALVPQSVVGGNSGFGVVGLPAPAAKGGTAVQLKCDHPEIVGLPGTLTVAENTNIAKFTITTHPVNSETTVRISMAAGEASGSNTLVLYPQHPPPSR